MILWVLARIVTYLVLPIMPETAIWWLAARQYVAGKERADALVKETVRKLGPETSFSMLWLALN